MMQLNCIVLRCVSKHFIHFTFSIDDVRHPRSKAPVTSLISNDFILYFCQLVEESVTHAVLLSLCILTLTRIGLKP